MIRRNLLKEEFKEKDHYFYSIFAYLTEKDKIKFDCLNFVPFGNDIVTASPKNDRISNDKTKFGNSGASKSKAGAYLLVEIIYMDKIYRL